LWSHTLNDQSCILWPAYSHLPVWLIHVTYLLTPWSRVLLEKLTDSAASQEIPHIFGTRRFLTICTSVRHLSLSWANSTQSPQPPPTSWRSILILSSHLRLGMTYLCSSLICFYPENGGNRFLWNVTNHTEAHNVIT
jgi:hypothetical protein